MLLNWTENTRDVTESKEVDDLDFRGETVRIFDLEFSADEDPVYLPTLAVDNQELPDLWEPHPADPWMYAVRKSTKFKSAYILELTVYYARIPEPLLMPAQVSYAFVTQQEPIDRDANGKAITNSSLETFDPPLTEEASTLILRVERNEASYNALIAADYMGSVNNDVFLGLPAGTCKLTAWDGARVKAAGLVYWEITYEIQIRYTANETPQKGWRRRILDQGFRIKDGTDADGKPKFKILKDTDGNPLTEPVLLDGAGARLAASNTNGVFLLFETAKKRPFGILNITLDI